MSQGQNVPTGETPPAIHVSLQAETGMADDRESPCVWCHRGEGYHHCPWHSQHVSTTVWPVQDSTTTHTQGTSVSNFQVQSDQVKKSFSYNWTIKNGLPLPPNCSWSNFRKLKINYNFETKRLPLHFHIKIQDMQKLYCYETIVLLTDCGRIGHRCPTSTCAL